MSSQLSLFDAAPTPSPRELGDLAATACLSHAESHGFDSAAAAEWIIEYLCREHEATGEQIVDDMKAAGHVPHDDRAFGSIIGTLARRKRIVCVGFANRRKGHGTSGARVWGINGETR